MTTTGLLPRGSSWALDNPPPRDPIGLETVEGALAAIRRAVTGNETRTAPCLYIGADNDGTPIVECLIATVVICAGVDPLWLRDWQRDSGKITAVELAHDLGLTRPIGQVLQAAQDAQDVPGGTWADGLHAAAAEAAELAVLALL